MVMRVSINTATVLMYKVASGQAFQRQGIDEDFELMPAACGTQSRPLSMMRTVASRPAFTAWQTWQQSQLRFPLIRQLLSVARPVPQQVPQWAHGHFRMVPVLAALL
jgi:hypothetical protein